MKILTDHQRKIAEENHGLIISFIINNHLNFEEYYGELAETYCIAITSYNKTKGKLSTYVFASLSNRMKNIYNKKTFEKSVPTELWIYLDEPLTAISKEPTKGDVIPDKGLSVEDTVMLRISLEQLIRELNPYELDLLYDIIFKNHTCRECAKIRKTTRTSYARHKKAVKEKVRRILSDTLN